MNRPASDLSLARSGCDIHVLHTAPQPTFVALRVRRLRHFLPRAGRPTSPPPMKARDIVAGSGVDVPPQLVQLPIKLSSSVTAPFRANALPSKMLAPVFIVILVRARIC